MRIVIGALVGCALIACASHRATPNGNGDDGDDDGTGSTISATLAITPPASELTIENGAAAQAIYTATLTYRDGTTRDVTAQTVFSTDQPTLEGTVVALANNQLTVTAALRLKVLAVYADVDVTATASANVTARVKSVRVDPTLPSTAPDLFQHPGVVALAPQIVYPPTGAVMPRNLGNFDVHCIDSHGNDVYEVSLKTELSDVRVYIPAGLGVAPTTPPTTPLPTAFAFTSAEWLAAIGMATEVTYQIRSVNRANLDLVGATAPRTVQLSNEIMDGGLYYWASKLSDGSPPGATGIFRHDMTRPDKQAEPFVTTNQTGGTCVGCHVLSRDGKQMAVTFQAGDGSTRGPAAMVDVANPPTSLAPQGGQWTFGTFTPDGAQFLSVFKGTLVVRDARTSSVIATMATAPAGAKVTHPDLSPDGTQLLYVRPSLPGDDLTFRQGQIYVRSYNQATHAFGDEHVLMSDASVDFYYPTWSPDGKWIAYTRCNDSSTIDSYDCHDASPWVMKADGTGAVQLAAANASAGLTNTALHWAPFAQTFGPTGEPMFWLTMSSKRDWGVVLINTGVAQQGRTAQLWMSPFFPNRVGATADPGAPAFRLPFQSVGSSNQTAQWTQRVVVLQ